MDADQLREVICELYDVRPEAKEYLEFWVDPDVEKEIEKNKIKIFKLFFISEGRPRKSNPDFKEMKKLMKYFSTLYVDAEHQIELKLYAYEIYAMWLHSRNKVSTHESRVETFSREIDEYIEANDLGNTYQLRFRRALDDFNSIFNRGDIIDRRGWRRWLRY